MISFIVYVLMVVFVAWFADKEDNNPWLWGGLSLFFSPVIVFIIYLLLTRLDVVSYRK